MPEHVHLLCSSLTLYAQFSRGTRFGVLRRSRAIEAAKFGFRCVTFAHARDKAVTACDGTRAAQRLPDAPLSVN